MHPDPRKRKRASETIDLTKEQPSQRQKIRNVQRYIDANLTDVEKEAMFNGVIIQKQAADETKRHLMALPEELRLQIFEYTILEDNPIIVTANGPQQPALLRVCREIRDVTLPMYYTCNGFVYDMMDYNMAELVPALRVHATYFDPPAPLDKSHWAAECRYQGRQIGFVGFDFSGVPNWQNLAEWIRISYEHEDKHDVPWFVDPENLETEYVVLTALSQAMINLRTKHVSWRAASSTLESWHRMLIMADAAWAT
ncbi:hypothetical protein LTR15_012463 [Elasticomyces elasticus]|nr:hypothetical protein LTR15_012463 [Elasticomyces elasticus]